MVCCFFNLHEKENAKNLEAHFDREIEIAIGRGCSVFMTGTNHPEDEIFAKRVVAASKYYRDGEINLIKFDEGDEVLKERFITLADWEIYAYEC